MDINGIIDKIYKKDLSGLIKEYFFSGYVKVQDFTYDFMTDFFKPACKKFSRDPEFPYAVRHLLTSEVGREKLGRFYLEEDEEMFPDSPFIPLLGVSLDFLAHHFEGDYDTLEEYATRDEKVEISPSYLSKFYTFDDGGYLEELEGEGFFVQERDNKYYIWNLSDDRTEDYLSENPKFKELYDF